jgi:23S rRNA (cytosine1962-C5)-methyltransferase
MERVKVTLVRGREKPVLAGHPWVFSGAVKNVEPQAAPSGAACDICAHDGIWLAAGYINTASQIICRVVSRNPEESWNESLLAERLDQALALRKRILPSGTDCIRLVNSEGDSLPGIVVDRYSAGLVVELNTAGAVSLREALTRLLVDRLGPDFIFENSSGPLRAEEGLSEEKGPLFGEKPGIVTVTENGHRFLVDPSGGQKTGFFIDQRDNRSLAARWMTAGGRALNLFCYTGAFSVYLAAAGAASVSGVDSSAPALETAAGNLRLGGLDPAAHPLIRADAFEYMRTDSGPYNLIVCDPPPLARRSSHVERASRAYKDINRLALGALAPGGVLLTFSCSGHIDPRLFRQIMFAAALEAGRQAKILAVLGAGADHPFSIYHPEGEYLKGLLIQVD